MSNKQIKIFTSIFPSGHCHVRVIGLKKEGKGSGANLNAALGDLILRNKKLFNIEDIVVLANEHYERAVKLDDRERYGFN